MSQENTEVVRRLIEELNAFMRGELSRQALFAFRDGKLCRVEYFRHRSDAMRAAGLSG